MPQADCTHIAFFAFRSNPEYIRCALHGWRATEAPLKVSRWNNRRVGHKVQRVDGDCGSDYCITSTYRGLRMREGGGGVGQASAEIAATEIARRDRPKLARPATDSRTLQTFSRNS
ncbi:hypothetical protein J6590_055698 [Homalodisca vitripennis]|nr:hypothetical protein J6590_055698 [Homalodisca vitripennis]